jgi:hypothetical protein
MSFNLPFLLEQVEALPVSSQRHQEEAKSIYSIILVNKMSSSKIILFHATCVKAIHTIVYVLYMLRKKINVLTHYNKLLFNA